LGENLVKRVRAMMRSEWTGQIPGGERRGFQTKVDMKRENKRRSENKGNRKWVKQGNKICKNRKNQIKKNKGYIHLT
jgi:hypothetical protein